MIADEHKANLPPPQRRSSMGKGVDEVVTDEVSPEVPPPNERGGEAVARLEVWVRVDGESEA